MFFLLEIGNHMTLETLAVSIPESVGILIFGVLLVLAAVTLRAFLPKAEKSAIEKEAKEAAGK